MTDTAVPAFGWVSGKNAHTEDYLHAPVLAELRAVKAQTVLDAGCGNGGLCRVLADAGFAVTGVDVDADGIAIALGDNPDLNLRVFGFASDPSTLITGGTFDAVVSTEVVEHLYSPHELARFAVDALRPGGTFVISTPYHGWLKNLILALFGKFDSHWSPLWHGGHIKFWSRDTLTRLLESAGLEVDRFVGAGRLPFLWKSMILVARKPSEQSSILSGSR